MRASIVIATFNDGEALTKTVRSCVETCSGLDYEIVVVDDASWDGSVEEVERRFPRLRVLRNAERLGPSPTKDRGARAASGQVLIFLDGHAKPERGALRRLVEDVEILRGRAVVTPTIVSLDVDRWRNAASSLGQGYRADLETLRSAWLPLSAMHAVREGARTFYESPAAIGCAFAVSRELYEALWGFDADMRAWGVEDVDFSLKCWLMGHPVLHDPEPVVGHRFRRSFDYEVPRGQLAANEIRFARKNFTHGVWEAWVEMGRRRHAEALLDHPEGLWTHAWQLFESRRASVEEERAYLMARRTRDELWYAERFGLPWPRIVSSGVATVASSSRSRTEKGVPLAAGGGKAFSATPSPPPPDPDPDPTPPCENSDNICCDCGCSEAPVRYFNGEVQFAVTDLGVGGYGKLWQHRRVYSNRLSYSGDQGNGYNWLVEQWPYLTQNGEGSITVVRGTRQALWFDLSGDTYVGRYGAKSTLTHDVANHAFVLASPTGEQWAFQDFDQTAYPEGLLKDQRTTGGQTTSVTAYTADGRIGEIQRSATLSGVTTTQSFLYAYNGDGRTTSLTLRGQVDGGAWNPIRKVLYEYYDGVEDYGSLGDLKRVRVQAPQAAGWADVATHYYRYYTASESYGFVHGLKYVVKPKTYARMVADGLDPTSVSNAALIPYADQYLRYDADRRVVLESIDGGSRTYTFAFTESGNAEGFNNWAVKTVETRPDGSQHVVYTNHIGQILLKDLRSGPDSWVEYHQFDAQARETLSADPSAVQDYNDAAPDLGVTLRAAAGLIHLTDYYAATGSGAAAGYVQNRKIQNGSAGTPGLLQSYTYASRTAAGSTVHPVAMETVYRNDDGTGAIVTSHAYAWHSGTTQVQQKTTTLPAVPTSQNGSGVSAVARDYYDVDGRRTWRMDERGFITALRYDVPTGALTQRIDDVDTSSTSGAPSGWTTPAGGGLNLVSDFEHDDLGRITQELGPWHTIDLNGTATSIRRATWTVYQDATYQIWTGQGYATGTTPNYAYTLLNPVAIAINDAGGNTLEEIQAVRSSTSGRLQPTDSFPQSSYVRWITYQYSDCCLAASQRVYHDIPAAGTGASGANYDQTNFGYDVMKRRNRTTSPGGTISFEVFDVRGNSIALYVGTNDAGATVTDPTGGGAAGNDMVVVTEFQYDGGLAGGDGNLTRETRHVDAATSRVTAYLYDWRNRRTDVDGEVDFYQKDIYDNLDRVVKIDRHDTDDEGNLVARNETLYDDRGRVYRTIRYAVDPSTGSVAGSQSQNKFYDLARNLLRQEPAGEMEYLEFEYDSLGRQISETDPLDHSLLFAYDAASNMISLTDQNEEVWTRGYDALSRLIRSTNPLDESVTYGFNAAGDQTTVTNALNETETSTFDAASRLVATSDPLSKVTSYVYDANGNRISVTDPNNLTTESGYDYLDRLVKVTDPAGHETKYEYNLVGELLVETDPKDHDTIHQYDSLGRRITTTDRLNHTTTFAWNVLGLQESITDAENQTTSYVYDGYGHLFQTIWPDHDPESDPGDEDYGITQSEYDDLNRVFRTTDQLGDTITFVYDDAGRLLSRDYRTAANSPSGPISDSDTFTYDDVGRVLTAEKERYSNTVTKTYDEAGRVKTESLTIHGETYTVEIGYDAAGRQSEITYPDGTIVERFYTARGQLEEIEYEGDSIDHRTYDGGGRLTTETLGNGLTVTTSYATNENLIASIANAAVGNYSYTWDANHNKLTETITGPMAGYGFTVPNGGYDDENRLIEWNRDDTNLDQEWDLSPVGDWNEFIQNTVVQTRVHGPVHELIEIDTTPLTYDPKGNLTEDDTGRTYAWDADNILVSTTASSVTVSYAYDALGRRASRTAGGVTTVYVSNGDIVLAEYASGTAANSPLRKYVNASYIDEPVLLIDRTAAGATGAGTEERLYYHRNQQYSITALTDNSGAVVERYSYTAYGQPTIYNAAGSSTRSTSNYGNPYLFTARAYEPDTTLHYFRARYYQSALGRFLSRDAVEYIDGMSLYRGYFIPRATDPLGLTEVDVDQPRKPFDPNWLDSSGCFEYCLSAGHSSERCMDYCSRPKPSEELEHPDWPIGWGTEVPGIPDEMPDESEACKCTFGRTGESGIYPGINVERPPGANGEPSTPGVSDKDCVPGTVTTLRYLGTCEKQQNGKPCECEDKTCFAYATWKCKMTGGRRTKRPRWVPNDDRDRGDVRGIVLGKCQ